MKVYKFSTPSCAYCKVVSPKVDAYAEEHGMEVIEVDASAENGKDYELTIRHNIQSVPVVLIAVEGAVEQKLSGFGEIMQFINQ